LPEKLKIAFVSNRSRELLNFRGGICQRLRDAGHEVIMIAPPDFSSGRFSEEGFQYFPFHMDIYNLNPVHEISIFRQLFSIYQKSRPDLIFHYAIKPNVYGTLAASMLRIPSVAVITGLGLFAGTGKKWLQKVSHGLYKFVIKFASEIWFLNSSDKEYFTNKVRVPGHKIYTLPGEGINTDKFKPVPRMHSGTVTRFLFAGRLVWAKGLRELAEAAEKIKITYPETLFQVAGSPETSNPDGVPPVQLEMWQKSGILEYLGDNPNIMPLLEKCDCAILPSYREGMSRFLLEASAMGIPVITTQVTGCLEIVQNGVTGWLCQPKNSEDLTDKILLFLSLSQDEQQKAGQAGRDYVVKHFDEKLVYQYYLGAIDRIVGANQKTQQL